eukprot:CCRYP_003649-RE/>CCRYP_003649-RE protein AED:0.50 eAED:1.00 QI:0/-1/0/1/-1/0/1/0/8
MGLALSTP